MNTIKTIAVVGATGHLAIPVLNALLANGFQVKAVVRNPEKARALLPAPVEIVKAELTDVASLAAAFRKTDAVYINLSMEITRTDLPFNTEREGVQNIVEAAKLNGVQQILKIGALGSYPLATHVSTNTAQNTVRMQGHQIIAQSGIPFTIFHPSSFIDNLFWMMKNNKVRWIGKPVDHYWTNTVDYARQVVAAIGNPKAMNQHYAIQGTERLSYLAIEDRLKKSFDPAFRIQATPVGMISFMGLFHARMKFVGQLFRYFENNPENFYGQQAWDDLGKPVVSVEELAAVLQPETVAA
jgi:uncharacterized protein YbjT (DUF2867 family)